MTDVTRILFAIEQGDLHASEQLLPLVYEELRRLAAQKMSQEAPGQTLQATALVHEAYLRLVASVGRKSGEQPHWNSRGHFFAAAAEAMRRILVDNARRKKALRRGGDRQRQDLDLAEAAVLQPADDLLALDEALQKLTALDPTKAELIKLRYFAGLKMEQAAEMLHISLATAHRYWAYSRAWLHHEIRKDEQTS